MNLVRMSVSLRVFLSMDPELGLDGVSDAPNSPGCYLDCILMRGHRRVNVMTER